MLLGKLFKLRDTAARGRGLFSDDEEKPFLEHLEDLRKMLVRIILTLLVSMIFSFIFRDALMDIVRYPVEMAGLGIAEDENLPGTLSAEQWIQAKKYAKHWGSLAPPQKEALLAAAYPEPEDAEVRSYVAAVPVLRAALSLPKERREAFVETASSGDPELLKRSKELLAANPNADLDSEGNLIRMSTFQPTEGFMLSFKLALYAGIVISFPLLLYFLAEFILPGLTPREKKLLLPAGAVGFLLFLTGVLFAYYVVVPNALAFFHEWNEKLGVANDWRIGYYASFVTRFTLIFGLAFELPVFVLSLVKLELLTVDYMRATRSYAVVIIFVLAAVMTPTPDIGNLCLLAGPMILLYEISIWIGWTMERKEAKRVAAESRPTRRSSPDPEPGDDTADQAKVKPLLPAAPAGTVPQEEEEKDDDGDGDDTEDTDESSDVDAPTYEGQFTEEATDRPRESDPWEEEEESGYHFQPIADETPTQPEKSDAPSDSESKGGDRDPWEEEDEADRS